jgi:hypothetical protein
MAKKEPFKFESNLNKIIPKIEETPEKVLNVIGQNLVKEIKPNVTKKTGRLVKSLGYWARKQEKDLQIGFKLFYAPFVFKHEDPIKPVVVKNAQLIKDMIAQAIDEIGKKRIEKAYIFKGSGSVMQLMFKTLSHETYINKQIILYKEK